MKKFTVFEVSIIGFFIGVIVAAYMTFTTSTGGYVSDLLSWVSLRPITGYFQLPENQHLIASFAFFIGVYTVYGAIVGIILKSILKPAKIIVPTIVLIGAVCLAQGLGAGQQNPAATSATDNGTQSAAALQATLIHAQTVKAQQQAKQEQYFGMSSSTETIGDLNNDEKPDIAFITYREDKDRGTLYYLVAAIATSTGHTGTNLVFLGDKVRPQQIGIENETIFVDYTISPATTTKVFYAQLIKGNLEKINATSTSATSSTPSL
ncbi:MAG: hypothetical protein WCQ60_01490 [bacterium]